MYCKKCGYQLKDNETICPFCKHDSNEVIISKKTEEKPKPSYGQYQNYFATEEEKCEKLRNNNGYVKLNTRWVHHLFVAAGGYLLMNLLSIIIVLIVQSIYTSKGYDFSCIQPDLSHDACAIGVFETYVKISSVAQLVAEILVVALIAVIFRKYIKEFIKQFKDNTTWKWFALGFALMYGCNFLYSTILTLLNVQIETNANQAAVNQVIINSPSLGFFFVVVAAPLFEEIIFRFGVFRCFTDKDEKKQIIGIVIVTLLFAGIHMSSTFEQAFMDPSNIDWALIGNDMLSLPVYLIGAFFLTFSYYKSKNLLTPITIHMAWNLLSYIANLLTPVMP